MSAINQKQFSDKESENILSNYLSDLHMGFTYFSAGQHKYLLPSEYKLLAEQIENFQVRDDDIWVLSFPKSGTTWTQEMVWMIGSNLDFEGSKVNLTERCPFLEISGIYNFQAAKKRNPDLKLPLLIENSVEYVASLPSPRYIKSHLPWELLPKQLRNGQTKAKMIYVARHPKDVCFSFFHHWLILDNFSGTFDNYLDLFLNDLIIYSPFWANIAGFWERRHQSNLLYITYETMLKDLEPVVRQVSEFLGKTLTDSNIKSLIDHLSFESMKKNPAVNMEELVPLIQELGNFKCSGAFMRQGGTKKNVLDAENTKRFNEWVEKNLKKYNLPIESV